MIPQTFIQDLLARVDIVDVIERYVPLKRAGANLVACCPFHTEKSPSFTVSPTKQFYHCFGCGAHGTAISFLMEHAGMGFVDAVKELAQAAGMQVPEERLPRARTAEEEGPDLGEMLHRAAQFYRQQLKSAPQAVEYLKGRGLTGEIARVFGIGYAPAGWQNLASVFADYGDKALVTAGLVIQGEEGKRYDRFRDRIMFPIVDTRGRIVGFGGRVLGAGEPKYLNSPETPLFEKGRELYGLFQARKAIRDAGRVLVVEGYMDVVALHQHGIEYAVATLGTATTPVHVHKLMRHADEIVFCFDGDAAGRRAAWRAMENSLAQLADGKQVKFLFLPEGEDPDTFVRSAGRDGLEQLIAAAQPLSAFLLNELASRVDRTTPEGRARLLQEAKPLVRQIAAPMLALMLRKSLADLAGLSGQELDREFQIKTTPSAYSAPARPAPPTARSMLRRLIELLLLDPGAAREVDRAALVDAAGLPAFDGRELAALSAVVESLACTDSVTSPGELFRGTAHAALVQEIESGLLERQAAGIGPAEARAEFLDGWNNLLEQMRRERLREMTEKLHKHELTPDDKARYMALLKASASLRS